MEDLLFVPLAQPPQIFNASVGIHGQLEVEKYLLPELWCLHLCRYHGVWMVDEKPYDIQPGTAILIPPNTPMEFHFDAGRHVHISIHFATRSAADNENKQRFAALQNLGDGFENAYRHLEEAVGWFSTSPARCEARIWDFLWGLNTSEQHKQLHPLVSRAIELIEQRLGQPISIADLATELGISHNHLTRQFRAATGLAPVDFIRERRVRYAQYLMGHSTLPIKAIASQVGLGDFHSFNKAMRRVSGYSPRQWLANSR
jgi:AraC-like DNA-binding protein